MKTIFTILLAVVVSAGIILSNPCVEVRIRMASSLVASGVLLITFVWMIRGRE